MSSKQPTSARAGRTVFPWPLLAAALASAGPACAGTVERATRRDAARVERQLAPLPARPVDDGAAQQPTPSTASFDGTLLRYQQYAFEHSPELRASFEAWRAATYRPRMVRRLPEVMISYAGFIRSVETRVGPQRHKLGLQQWFPWPTKLTAASEAEALAARAAQREFEAHALRIAAEVSAVYWRLWLIKRTREVEAEQLSLLQTVAEFVRVRVEASAAALSDLTQINLRVTRAEDHLAALDEDARTAAAALVRVVGAPDGAATPIDTATPRIGVPGEDDDSLRLAATSHPRVRALALMSESSDQRVRQSRADRFPSFGLGVDWIITGPAADPTMPDSGKDAVMGMAAIKVPLSFGSYSAGEDEARARSRMFRARELAARNHAVEDFERVMARLRDADRRVALYDTTMIPLAETSYEAVQASYQSGRASVVEVLMAERELLDLRLMALRARVDAAIAWAELEQVVGRPVRASKELR
ncbi:MAG: TolC family protein [Nannocystaceae bacterium]|nr:TolC family protein [Myxococcales bacterium]